MKALARSAARRLAALLLAFAACLSHADAQQEETVKLRFLSFPQVANPEPVELLIGEGRTVEVNIPGNELSQPYSVPVLSAIVVGKKTTNEEGQPVFKEYGRANAIAAAEQIVLLLRKGATPEEVFVVLPVDGTRANFKAASFLFINASNLAVGGLIGDQKFGLKPGERRMLQPKPNHPGGICQVTFSYLRGEKWKTVYDTRWPADEKFRSMVFFYQDPATGRLGVAPIIDVLPFKGQ